MSTQERIEIKERVYPAACRGEQWALDRLSELSRSRRLNRTCLCGCGRKVKPDCAGFATALCCHIHNFRRPLTEQERKVIRLRSKGKKWDRIAKLLGMSNAGAHNLYHRALQRMEVVYGLTEVTT